MPLQRYANDTKTPKRPHQYKRKERAKKWVTIMVWHPWTPKHVVWIYTAANKAKMIIVSVFPRLVVLLKLDDIQINWGKMWLVVPKACRIPSHGRPRVRIWRWGTRVVDRTDIRKRETSIKTISTCEPDLRNQKDGGKGDVRNLTVLTSASNLRW
jgi:hypothetical protein